MENIKEKIKEEYTGYLTNEEIKSIDNLNIDHLKDLVNKIWQRFLIIEETFLVIELNPALMLDDLDKALKKPLKFKVLSPNLQNTYAGECGFIISIDWLSTETIFLPKDLFESKRINANYHILKVYSINNGEGSLSISYDNAMGLADTLKLDFLSFNKYDYDKDYQMDYDTFLQEIFTDYILNKYHKTDISLRDDLIKKYGDFVIEYYKTLQDGENYQAENFINYIYTYLNEKENTKKKSLFIRRT